MTEPENSENEYCHIAGGGGDGFGVPDAGGVDIDGAISAWEAKIAEFKDRLSKKIDDTFIAIRTQWETSALGQFVTKIAEAFDPALTNQEGIQIFLDTIFGKNVDPAVAASMAGFLDTIYNLFKGYGEPGFIERIAQFTLKNFIMGKVIDTVFGPGAPIVKAIDNIFKLYVALKTLYDWAKTGNRPDAIVIPTFVGPDIKWNIEDSQKDLKSLSRICPSRIGRNYAITPPPEKTAEVQGYWTGLTTIVNTAYTGATGVKTIVETNSALISSITDTQMTAMQESSPRRMNFSRVTTCRASTKR